MTSWSSDTQAVGDRKAEPKGIMILNPTHKDGDAPDPKSSARSGKPPAW